MEGNLFMQTSSLIKRALIFLALAIFCDRAIGALFDKLASRAKGGFIARDNFIVNSMNSPVVILGSSRALHHYVPKIISDSLHSATFNCGKDGRGIIYEYGIASLFLQRYQPEIVIIDIIPNFDITPNDNSKYIDLLKPYYSNQSIRAIIDDVDKFAPIKMESRAFRYNSRIFSIIKDGLISRPVSADNGYIPEPHSSMLSSAVSFTANTNLPQEVDSTKIKYMRKLFEKFQGKSKVYITISPTYLGSQFSDNHISLLNSLASSYGFQFRDFSNDPEFLHNSAVFYDPGHLNDSGARLFSSKLSSWIISSQKSQ